MKEILFGYAAYNHWANQKIGAVLRKLGDDTADQELVSSFPSLRKTVYHLWYSESMWYQRLQLIEKAVDPTVHFEGTFEEAIDHWLQQSMLLQDWVNKATAVRLEHTVAYINRKKEYHKIPVKGVLHHVFNHSTYHRGQLVTLLRQVGISKIPGLDYHEFIQGKKV
jgi:uncharacterized damage-inducible protein DinB